MLILMIFKRYVKIATINIMKTNLVILIAILSLAMASQPPQPVARYETLGYDVIEYSNGDETFYEVYAKGGGLVARANLLGFVEWKKGRLLELIGSDYTTANQREQYKLMYQEIVDKENAFNQFAANYAAGIAMNRRATFAASAQSLVDASQERTRQIYGS